MTPQDALTTLLNWLRNRYGSEYQTISLAYYPTWELEGVEQLNQKVMLVSPGNWTWSGLERQGTKSIWEAEIHITVFAPCNVKNIGEVSALLKSVNSLAKAVLACEDLAVSSVNVNPSVDLAASEGARHFTATLTCSVVGAE